MLLALLIGVAAGCIAALRQNRATDYAVMAAAMTGISIPNFVMAPLLILVFAVYLRWLPAGGLGGLAHDGASGDRARAAADRVPRAAHARQHDRGAAQQLHSHGAAPRACPLGKSSSATPSSPRCCRWCPILGPAAAAVITGSVVIEQIFGVPGIGRFFVTGALNRDYTLVMGVVVFYGALILVFNFLVDLVYAWLDPRVKYE